MIIEMIIEWKDIQSGTPFLTNGVPFENILMRERNSRSDKTWKRWDRWSAWFHRLAGAIERSRVVYRNDPDFERLAEELDSRLWQSKRYCDYMVGIQEATWWLFGHCVARQLWWVYKDGDITGWTCQIGPFFTVKGPNDEVIFRRRELVQEGKLPEVEVFPYRKDWEVIHYLSGQAVRRKMRIAIAQTAGTLAPYALASMGAGIPVLEPTAEELIPLVEWDFLPSRRGDGWVVTGLGKVLISRTNQPGYYKIVREADKVRFIELVEPFKILKEKGGEKS